LNLSDVVLSLEVESLVQVPLEKRDIELQINDEVFAIVVVPLLYHSFDEVATVLLRIVWHLKVAFFHVQVKVP
jgi:hypothetical protein